MWKNTVVVALALGLLTGTLGVGLSASAERPLRVGEAAPDIAGGPWINSEPLSMDKLRGRVVYVEFWTYG